MASPPNLEEPDPTMATFNTGHTSGGTVNNVNGDFIVHGGLTYTINCIVEGPAPDMRQLLEVLPKIYTTPTIAPSLGAKGHPTVCGPMPAQIMAATYVTINNVDEASAKDSSIEIRVIAEMMDLLLETPSFHHSDTLPETLASLRRMLMLTELALRAYRQTPLAQTLNRAIIAEAERCHQLLKDLFKRLSDYRHTLPAVLFQFIRQYVWSTAGEGLEISELNSKLGQCHSSLAACILALGSAAWPELERGQGGKAALAEFYSLFAQESASLRHIQIDTVIVIDHLGRNLPVPTIFCNSWQDFHAVIVGHCTSFAGDSLVQRGDYRILKQDNDQVIAPAELSSTIRPGMTVEMSIVLREQAPEEYGGAEHKCPRCSHMNRKFITASGWVSCQRCCANFQVLSHTGDNDGDEQELVSPEVQQLESDTIPDEQYFFRRISILLANAKTLVTPPRYVQRPLFSAAHPAEPKSENRRSRSSSVDSDVAIRIWPPSRPQSDDGHDNALLSPRDVNRPVPLPGESSHRERPSIPEHLVEVISQLPPGFVPIGSLPYNARPRPSRRDHPQPSSHAPPTRPAMPSRKSSGGSRGYTPRTNIYGPPPPVAVQYSSAPPVVPSGFPPMGDQYMSMNTGQGSLPPLDLDDDDDEPYIPISTTMPAIPPASSNYARYDDESQSTTSSGSSDANTLSTPPARRMRIGKSSRADADYGYEPAPAPIRDPGPAYAVPQPAGRHDYQQQQRLPAKRSPRTRPISIYGAAATMSPDDGRAGPAESEPSLQASASYTHFDRQQDNDPASLASVSLWVEDVRKAGLSGAVAADMEMGQEDGRWDEMRYARVTGASW